MSEVRELRCSLLICSRGRADELRALVKRLKSSVVEESPFEIVVVEDCSVASTPPSPISGVVYIAVSEHGAGFGRMRQKAVDAASAEIIVFIDDDCIPCDGWLNELLTPFVDPGVVAVGGGIIPQQGNAIASAISLIGLPAGGFPRLLECGDKPVDSELLSTGNLALRRQAVVETGGFDAAHQHGGEDQQLVGKLSGRKLFMPTALVEHRNRETFGEVWHWFVRRGRGEYAINRLAGMGPVEALISPWRWSWSWRVLLLLLIAIVAGPYWALTSLGIYYIALGGVINIRNSGSSPIPIVEERLSQCMSLEAVAIAPAVRFCMDFAREFGRLQALSTKLDGGRHGE